MGVKIAEHKSTDNFLTLALSPYVCVCARVYNYSNNIIFSSKTVEVEASTSTEVEGEAEMKHVRYD